MQNKTKERTGGWAGKRPIGGTSLEGDQGKFDFAQRFLLQATATVENGWVKALER